MHRKIYSAALYIETSGQRQFKSIQVNSSQFKSIQVNSERPFGLKWAHDPQFLDAKWQVRGGCNQPLHLDRLCSSDLVGYPSCLGQPRYRICPMDLKIQG